MTAIRKPPVPPYVEYEVWMGNKVDVLPEEWEAELLRWALEKDPARTLPVTVYRVTRIIVRPRRRSK